MWDKLSIKDKAKVMKIAVESGLTNLDKIKEVYNNHVNKFEDGGDVNNVSDEAKLDRYNRLYSFKAGWYEGLEPGEFNFRNGGKINKFIDGGGWRLNP